MQNGDEASLSKILGRLMSFSENAHKYWTEWYILHSNIV